MLQIEQEVVAFAIERAKETHHHVPQADVDRVVEDYEKAKGFQLSKEQRHALDHITGAAGAWSTFPGSPEPVKRRSVSVFGQLTKARI